MNTQNKDLRIMFYMTDLTNVDKNLGPESFEEIFGTRYGPCRDRQIDAKHSVTKKRCGQHGSTR